MIFQFLKYVTPTWYFNLKPKTDHTYFPSLSQLRKDGFELEIGGGYTDDISRKLDLSWNAFQAGYLNRRRSIDGIDIWNTITLPIEDEYRFIRRNFNPLWSFYILFIRIITFHSPLAEIKGFWSTRNVTRISHSKNTFKYSDYTDFKSKIVEDKPLVSIVIPTLNRYSYLKDVFKDIENQTYSNVEVIVVDQSEPFQESSYTGWNFKLKYWFQQDKALWKARNSAIQSAKGKYILLYDDDSLVETDWIEQHVKALDYFDADLSSGVSISSVGAKVPPHYSYFRWSDQLDTGNVLIKREVFEKIGLFDRQFEKQRMGDGEYGMRAYLAGFRNISNPYAKRIHLKGSEGGLRQMGSWDAFRTNRWFAPKPIPSVLYFYRKYFGAKMAILNLMVSIPSSILPYRFKSNKALLLLFIGISPVVGIYVFIQILISWKQASEKLKQGSKIDFLV